MRLLAKENKGLIPIDLVGKGKNNAQHYDHERTINLARLFNKYVWGKIWLYALLNYGYPSFINQRNKDEDHDNHLHMQWYKPIVKNFEK
ncbi:hypothetical protein [Thorsellia kenyensis]|uniref:Uncharacterized protein n=1 Tax=Thorsellia kenyensis TaxID=1549888 RepID=A0ABV6CCL3_9GAMM